MKTLRMSFRTETSSGSFSLTNRLMDSAAPGPPLHIPGRSPYPHPSSMMMTTPERLKRT